MGKQNKIIETPAKKKKSIKPGRAPKPSTKEINNENNISSNAAETITNQDSQNEIVNESPLQNDYEADDVKSS